jgi:hypothetical protein
MRSSSAGLVGTIEEATGAGGEGTAREATYQSRKNIRDGKRWQVDVLAEAVGRAEVITGGREAAGGGGGAAGAGGSSSHASAGALPVVGALKDAGAPVEEVP